jgi:hypothetical protein
MYKEVKTSVFVIVIVAVVVLCAGGAGAYYYFSNKNSDAKKTSGSANKSSTAVVDEEADETSDAGETPDTEKDENGWTIYKNYKYSYLISVPSDATLSDQSENPTGDNKDSDCIEIKTDNYSIRIAPELDENNPTACLRTGFGADWAEGPTDSINIQGIDYSPTGMHTEAASAGYYQDYFHIDLVDGHRIEYGISVNEKYGTITKEEAKSTLHKVLQTYSPAE